MAEGNEQTFQSTDESTKVLTETEIPSDTTQSEVITRTPPTPSPEPSKPFNEHDILAEQFANYWRIAQALMKTLRRPKDIEICTNLLSKVQRLNDSKHLEVKRNNNAFFRYCLKVLKWTSDNQPLELYKCWVRK